MESKRSHSTTFDVETRLPFNRTSMESKLVQVVHFGVEGFAFNRTSMESKQMKLTQHLRTKITFNRTSMESKLTLEYTTRFSHSLLIEPVWNRNA